MDPADDKVVPNKEYTIGYHNNWVYEEIEPRIPVGCTIHSFKGTNLSHGHKRDRDGKYRSGGSWVMYKEENSHSISGETNIFRPGWNTPAYQGKLFSLGHVSGIPRLQDLDDTETQVAKLTQRGAEAWNRLRPDLPDFSLATSIYEMKDFIPTAKESLRAIMGKVSDAEKLRRANRKSGLSRAGQFYLAANFGYLPLLSDIRNYVKAQRNAQKRLAQLIRDAGKPVRRRTNLVDNSTPQTIGDVTKVGYTGTWGEAYLGPLLVTQCYQPSDQSGSTTTLDQVSATWAEGSFRYFLPPGPRDVVWTKKMIKRIMGHRITPRELYQVMPWSWLIDYFTNLGDLVDNLSAGVADMLICDYAYLMQTRTERLSTVSTTRYVVSNDGSQREVEASYISLRTAKVRIQASPFGWGLRQEDLNLRQSAILGALGFSRLP